MSAAKAGPNNPFYGKTGESHSRFGAKGVKPSHSIKTSLLNIKTKEVLYFNSQRDAGAAIGVSHKTIQRALRSKKIINGLYVVQKESNNGET